ncbi:hypothetical protein BC830DRAFT_1167456 [Chytriomyces sp. MP71]|nr:hypothetical protein BC830DRAFT_1167456 [Chytriomyces sp. MP71]
MSNPSQRSSSNEASLRLQLLYTMLDILMLGVSEAFAPPTTSKTSSSRNLVNLKEALLSRNIDDLIWTWVFHKKIEQLRTAVKDQIRKDPTSQVATKNLLAFLATATTFYRTLIQSVSVHCSAPTPTSFRTSSSSFQLSALAVRLYMDDSLSDANTTSLWKSKDDMELAKMVQRIVYRSTVYLGDLAHSRYSISNVNPPAIAKGNLQAFHKNVSSRLPERNTAVDASTVTIETLSTSLIIFHARYLFSPLERWDAERAISASQHFTTMVDVLLNGAADADEAVDDVVSTRACPPVQGATAQTVRLCVIILIAAFSEMGKAFAEGDKPPQARQRIRDVQCVILSTLLGIAEACLVRLQTYMTQTGGGAGSLSGPDEAATLFAPVGLLCAWMLGGFVEADSKVEGGKGGNAPSVLSGDVFELFVKYTQGPGVVEGMKKLYESLLKFSRALATLSTILLAYADTDGDPRTMPEDIPLLGFTPLRTYFREHLDSQDLQLVLDGKMNGHSDASLVEDEFMLARASRVLLLARRMSERKAVSFFGYEGRKMGPDGQAGFMVHDEESKRLSRLKTAKTLALQLLKAQISTLESSLADALPTTFIPDASIYTGHLPLIKALILPAPAAQSRRRILVPQDVVHELDQLKRGTDTVNVRAREATRYLEQRFRYGTDALVAQQTGETVAPAYLEVVKSAAEGVAPPRALRSFIGCAAFAMDAARKARLEMGVEAGDGDVWVVSENEEMRLECLRCGIPVKSVSELRKAGVYPSTGRRQ